MSASQTSHNLRVVRPETVLPMPVLDFDGTLVEDGTNPTPDALANYAVTREQILTLLKGYPRTLTGVMSGRTLAEVKSVSDFFLAEEGQRYYSFLSAENGSVIEVPVVNTEDKQRLLDYAREKNLRVTELPESIKLLTASYSRADLFKSCIQDVLSENQISLDHLEWAHSEIPEDQLAGEQAKLLARLSNNAELDFVKTIVSRESGIVVKFKEQDERDPSVQTFLSKLAEKCSAIGVRYSRTVDTNSDGSQTVNVDIAQSDKGQAIRHLNQIFSRLNPEQAIVPAHIGNASNDIPAFEAALELEGQACLVDSDQLKRMEPDKLLQLEKLEHAGMCRFSAIPEMAAAACALFAIIQAASTRLT